ncbi:MAG: sigma-54-dependent Fis family transcriptional regulator [Desulfobacteraceae bacterium]|nr:sigma-54-dependent Fis family transcriptional regulator [Desulfobacteraceae bacterium]
MKTERQGAGTLLDGRKEGIDFFEKSTMGVVIVSKEGKIVALNPACARIFGYESPEYCLGIDLAVDWFVNLDPGERRERENIVLETGHLENSEKEFRKKDGSVFYAHVNIFLIRPRDSGDYYFEAYLVDITRRKQVEQELHCLFENTGTATFVVEEDMTVSKVNGQFTATFGYSRSRVEGRIKWPEMIHPDDRDRMKGYHWARRYYPGRAPSEYECRVLSRQGVEKFIHIKVGMIPKTGKSVVSYMDITSLKNDAKKLAENEARLAGLVDAFNGFIYVTSSDYTIESMNKALVERTGYDGRGGHCYKVIHDLDAPCSWCASDRVFQGESVAQEVKSPKDGRWYYCLNSPEFKDNRVVRKRSTIIDITVRKRAEEKLLEEKSRLEKENRQLKNVIKSRSRLGNIVGKSPAMQNVYGFIPMAGASHASVIIHGESGTGKELVARAIHDMSHRHGHPFVTVNCGAIPEQLIESEFFGYRKGGFSGADRDQKGFLDMADKGTLFLDEVGDIGLKLQVKLLRAIEGSGYFPVGSNQLIRPDVRIVAATNRTLPDLVEKGLIRPDFYFRLNVLPIHLPPLREKKEDIPLLVDYFYREKFESFHSDGGFPARLMDRLMAYHWPGNVRELQNVLHRYLTLGEFDISGEPGIDIPVNHTGASPEPLTCKVAEQPLGEAVEQFEKKLILNVLESTRWHRARAASILKINRRTLFKKIKKYGLDGA